MAVCSDPNHSVPRGGHGMRIAGANAAQGLPAIVEVRSYGRTRRMTVARLSSTNTGRVPLR